MFETVGDFPMAIADFRNIAKLQAEQTEPHYTLSLALYKSGDAEESLNAIRECLKLDNDHQACKKHYTFLRKLVKQLQGIKVSNIRSFFFVFSHFTKTGKEVL